MNFKDYLITDLSTLQKGEPVIVAVTNTHTGRKGWETTPLFVFDGGQVFLSSWHFECWDAWNDLFCIENPNIDEGGVLYLRKDSALVYKIDWYKLFPDY